MASGAANPVGQDLDGKTVVITGATGGIGLETAVVLASRGARLALVGRDRTRGEAALARIRGAAPGVVAEMHHADLSRLDEVRSLAETLNAALPRIDVLLNNAGGMFARREETADGLERTFALNHMAYVALSLALREKLVASAPARIVNVASEAHRGVTLDLDDLQATRGYAWWPVYRRSKLANILFTRELARRLAGTGVTVNCLHPGFVATGIGNNNGGVYGLGMRLAKLFALSLDAGARTPIHVVTAPELATTTGTYVVKSRVTEPSGAARDDAVARRLWDQSLAIAGLTDS
ncbi:MAG: SDR family oxidoreductase [Rhodoplanes sp.]|nr:SDR family oxidoreductase [Rhodoplanes sp.]